MRAMFNGPQSSTRSNVRSALPSSGAGESRQHGPRLNSKDRVAAVTSLVNGAADTLMRGDLLETAGAVFDDRAMPESQDPHFWRQMVSAVLDSAGANVDGSTIADHTKPVARAIAAGALFKAVVLNRIDLESAYALVANGSDLPAVDDREKFAAVRATAAESLASVLAGVGIDQSRRSLRLV